MPSIASANAATKQELRDVSSITVFANFADGDATPSVSAGGTFKTTNTTTTIITNFDSGYNGQRINVVINDANTIIDFTTSTLIGNYGVAWSPIVGDSFTAVFDGTNWYCQLIGGILDHNALTSTGTNTHIQIDTHIAAISPHNNWILANNSTDFETTPIALGERSLAIGDFASTEDGDSLAIGTYSTAEGFGNIAIGSQATAFGDTTTYNVINNVAIGPDSSATGDTASLAVGDSATATGIYSTAIGWSSTAQGLNAIGIGYVNASNDYQIKLGTTDANTISIESGRIALYGYNDTELGYTSGTYYKENTSATALTTLSLPAAIKGMTYVIERVAPYTYQINPSGTEYFSDSTAGKYKSLDTDGAYIKIECLSTGIWHVMASLGTITDEP